MKGHWRRTAFRVTASTEDEARDVVAAIRERQSFREAEIRVAGRAIDVTGWLDVSQDDLLEVWLLTRRRGLAMEPARPSR